MHMFTYDLYGMCVSVCVCVFAVLLEDIDRITYPTRTSILKKKKNSNFGQDTMKFTMETSDMQVVQFLAKNMSQLVTWLLGIQGLAAKPGQVRPSNTKFKCSLNAFLCSKL